MIKILSDLFSYEKQRTNHSTSPVNSFINNTTWYVNQNYMANIFAYPFASSQQKIPGLYRTKVFGLMKNYLFDKSCQESFPSNADVIQLKESGERVRAFYETNDNKRYSIKIVRDSEQKKFIEPTRREVGLRKHLQSLGTINVPEIMYGEYHNDSYVICEKMVLGRRFNGRIDYSLYKEKMLPQLRNTYIAHGVDYQPLQDFMPTSAVNQVLCLIDKYRPCPRFQKALERILETNSRAAVSLCHGGLGPCNIAVCGGDVYFLDWKFAGNDLIIVDLMRTAVKYKNFSYIVNEIRKTMVSDFMSTGYKFDDLFTISIALEINRRMTKNAVVGLLSFWGKFVPANYGEE